MPNKIQKFLSDPFLIGGSILALWALANTYLDITRYGIDQGFYWWFCNLALTGVAGGLLFKHRGWLTGFLSIACFTQIFWVVDNNYRVLFRENLFGLVEFMYQPGLPLDEFLLSHYHYFTIPVALIALFYLPQKKSNTLLLISIFNPFIFAVSYFCFPKTQNVNCIHEPCFPGLGHWAGPTYSLLFWFIIFVVHLGIGYTLERFFVETHFSDKLKKGALTCFIGFCTLALILAGIDTQYRKSLPSFTCNTAKAPEGTLLKCGFTLDYKPQKMLFVYRMENTTKTQKYCTSAMDYQGQITPMHTEFILPPKSKKRLEIVLPYPEKTVAVNIEANCNHTPTEVRDVASPK